MIKNNDEAFDEKVERFLRKQLSPEEEEAFKKELSQDSEKLKRAKAIALAIKSMRNISKNEDTDVISAIKDVPKESVSNIVDGSFYIDFDARVEKFLRGRMTAEEELMLKKEFASFPELLSRAKAMGMVVIAMNDQNKNKDKYLVESIKRTDTATLQRFAKGKTNTNSRKMFFNWSIGIAASILILFGIGIRQYNIYQVKMIGNEYGNEFVAISLTQDRGSEHDSIAIAELSSILYLLQYNDSISYAASKLETIYNEYPKTIGNKDDWYMAYVSWHLSITYLRMGKKTEAIPILNSIIENYEGTPMAKKASEILEKL